MAPRPPLISDTVRSQRGDVFDPGPYPIPLDARIEAGSDRHTLALQQGSCKLYEPYHAEATANGWEAGSGAAFDLRSGALRPNVHMTLKANPLKRPDLDEFVACYHAENRFERKPTWSDENAGGRWRPFIYDELTQRGKVNLDIFWLKDDSLEDAANLPEPDIIAADIIEDLGAALAQFELIQTDLTTVPEA